MAQLAAAFGSSHSVMLAAELQDWLRGFRQSDLRMKYYDREGRPRSYAEVLAQAPANIAELVADDAITSRYHQVQEAMKRLRAEIAQAKLDALVVVGATSTSSSRIRTCLDRDLLRRKHPQRRPRQREKIQLAGGLVQPRADAALRGRGRRRLSLPQAARAQAHRGLVEREFDVAAVAGLADGQNEGHAYSFIHRWYLKGEGARMLPIVPIFLTPTTAQSAAAQRCVKFGKALKELIESFPEDLRIGVLASGGLSHFVVEEKLDHAVIEALRKKDLDFLAGLERSNSRRAAPRSATGSWWRARRRTWI